MRSLHFLIAIMLIFTMFNLSDQSLGSENVSGGGVIVQHEIFSQLNISYAGGNGTWDNPYQISNISQLQYAIHNLSSNFKIVNDIDASVTTTWNNGSGFVPIGNESSPFDGTFDGGRYNISGLIIDRPSTNYVGLIGYATNNTEISNVTLISCKVEGYDYVGGLIAYTSGNISNCSTTGEVKGRHVVGGLIGRTYSNKWRNSYIDSCYSDSNVSGRGDVGGLAGLISGIATRCRSQGNVHSSEFAAGGLSGTLWGSLYDSFSTAEVDGQRRSGGLIGGASIHDELTRCIATGNVSGTRYVGGLIGSASGYIDNCSAHGDVIGEDDGIGGLVGYKSGGVFENCFATGSVTADEEAGGLVGINRWNTLDCYSTGKVIGMTRSGASIGVNLGIVNRTYFNNQTSGITIGIENGTTTGATGKDLEDMLQKSTYKDWNFTDIWGIGNGQTYPFFKWKENKPPVIITEDVTIATIRAPYTFRYERVENDVTDIIPHWSLDTNADWLQVNLTTGMLHGVPGVSDLGPHYINISVNDGRDGVDYHNFTLNMNSTNNMPKILTTPVKFVNEDDVYRVDYEAFTDVGDVLEWSLTTNASWLQFDGRTGILTGFPDYTEIGTYSLNVTVTDGQGAVDWQEFTLTVNETNDYPMIKTKDVIETYEHIPYQVQYKASDEENDAMTWSLRTNASWLSFNKAQRILSGRPGYGTVGHYWVNITVIDARGGSDRTNFTLQVIDHPIKNGSGTIYDPFIIMNATQLQLANLNLDGHYVLGQDIDANETRKWNDGKGFLPIGKYIFSEGEWIYNGGFNGTLDGKGNTINDLYINRPNSSYIGLIGGIGSASSISNIDLLGIDIKGDSKVGGLVGVTFRSEITRCNVEGQIQGNISVGGLVGESWFTTIKWCNANIEVNGNYKVGGFIGYHNGAWDYFSEISYCSSKGLVSGGSSLGGFVGSNYHLIRSSFSHCIVNGGGTIGGFVGSNDGYSTFTIENCYSSGDVYGRIDNVAGFVGRNRHSITKCYSLGRVTSLSEDQIRMGLFIADDGYDDEGIVDNCTVHIDALPSGNASMIWIPGFSIKTTDELVRRSTFKNMGWDLDTTWNQIDNHTYPYFSWQDTESPTIVANDNLTVYENVSYSVNYTSTDPDPTDIYAIWSIATNASWLSMDPDTGVLSGTASNDDLGSFWVNITASDGRGGSDWHNITIEVMNTNTAPIILTRDVTSVLEDNPYIVNYEGIDVDPTNDILSWSLTTNAEWLEIDENTGILSGYPEGKDVGTYLVRVTLSDDKGASDHHEFILRVINTNDPPLILTNSIPDAIEDEQYLFQLDGMDLDYTGDILSWSIEDTNADFLDVRIFEGLIEGYPRNEDVGPKWVVIALDDGNGGIHTMNYSFEVINTNDPPKILTEVLPDAFENEFYSFYLEVEDLDPVEEEFYWTLEIKPNFLTIDHITGQITGSPGDFDVNEWSITIKVTDDSGGQDKVDLSLTVNGINDAPGTYEEHIHISLVEDREGISLDLNDLFFDIENDKLTFKVSEGMHLSIAIVKPGILNITPDQDWSGRESITVTAFDGEVNTSLNISVVVTPINDPPTDIVIEYNGPYIEGGQQIVEGSASDPDLPYGDELEFRWSIKNVGSIGTGRSINLSLEAGSYQLILRVTDSDGAFNETSIPIRIDPYRNGATPDEKKWYSEPSFVIPMVLILLLILTGLIFIYRRDTKKTEKKTKSIEHIRDTSEDPGRRAPSLFGLDTSVPQSSPKFMEVNSSEIENISDQGSLDPNHFDTERSTTARMKGIHLSLDNLIEEAVDRSEGSHRHLSREEMEVDLKDQYEQGIMDRKTYTELKRYLEKE